MSESSIQTAIQTILRATSQLADASVVINDWSILDDAFTGSPWAVIQNADDFDAPQEINTNVTWSERVTLMQAFTDWSTALNAFRDLRQAVIDQVNSTTGRSLGGMSGMQVRTIRAGSPVRPFYAYEVADPNEAEPIGLEQDLIFVCEEF